MPIKIQASLPGKLLSQLTTTQFKIQTSTKVLMLATMNSLTISKHLMKITMVNMNSTKTTIMSLKKRIIMIGPIQITSGSIWPLLEKSF